MTPHSVDRTPTTSDMLTRARAEAHRIRGGFRESGPFAELLLERGLSPEDTARAVSHFTKHLRKEMIECIGEERLNDFARQSTAALNAYERARSGRRA